MTRDKQAPLCVSDMNTSSYRLWTANGTVRFPCPVIRGSAHATGFNRLLRGKASRKERPGGRECNREDVHSLLSAVSQRGHQNFSVTLLTQTYKQLKTSGKIGQSGKRIGTRNAARPVRKITAGHIHAMDRLAQIMHLHQSGYMRILLHCIIM